MRIRGTRREGNPNFLDPSKMNSPRSVTGIGRIIRYPFLPIKVGRYTRDQAIPKEIQATVCSSETQSNVRSGSIFGSRHPDRRGLLCPHKRTSSAQPVRSGKCQKRKWKTQFDQTPNAFAVHRDVSCLEPCLGSHAGCPARFRGGMGKSAARRSSHSFSMNLATGSPGKLSRIAR